MSMNRYGGAKPLRAMNFICHAPQPHLDRKHTVFGQTIQGDDVIDKIKGGDQIKKVWIEG